jgi:hypothetical protein
VHTLPQLLAALLLETTVDQPGWREARKLAGRPYAQGTGLSEQFGTPQSLAGEVLANREHVIRLIDLYTASLVALRKDIYDQNKDMLIKRFQAGRSGRERWMNQRMVADWAAEDTAPPVEMPTAKEAFSRMIGFGRKPKPKPEKDN